jgi:hypothetical protein
MNQSKGIFFSSYNSVRLNPIGESVIFLNLHSRIHIRSHFFDLGLIFWNAISHRKIERKITFDFGGPLYSRQKRYFGKISCAPIFPCPNKYFYHKSSFPT